MTPAAQPEDLDLLATVFDVARIGICIIAEDGRFTRVNPAFCAMVGYAEQELIGREYWTCAPPAIVAARERFLEAAMDDSPRIPGEWQIRRRDGTLFDALVSSRPVTRGNGQRFIVATFSDITERKAIQVRMEQLNLQLAQRVQERTAELAENERKYRRIIDVTREGFWLVDGWGRTLEVNQSLCALLGYELEELKQKSAEEMFDQKHRPLIRHRLYPRPKPGHGQYELELVTKSGQHVPVLVNTATQLNAQGEPEFAAAFITDISGRKQLEHDLARTLSEREAILESSVAGMAFVRERSFVWVNKAFEQDMLGFESGELAGKSISVTYPTPDLFENLEPQITEVLRQRGMFQIEEQVRRKDGALIWALVSGRLVNRNHPHQGSIWTIVDISKRKSAEAELLESLAREKEASELKSRFVSMTSHEFRTPLAAIMSSTELISDYGDRLPGEEKAELVSVIKSSVKRMTQMLEDILLIGRADAGRLEFRPDALALEPLCRGIVAEVRKVTQTSHDLHLDFQLDRTIVHLDERLLRHILHNLLINAIKYSPDAAVVTLRVVSHGRSVVLEVLDQGIGIPAQDRAGLFTSFFRGRNVGNIAGTGLGLAIVKKAVDLHGGRVAVVSAEGKGTTFTVKLPDANVSSHD